MPSKGQTMLIRPDDFTRAFVVLWGQRDAAGLASLCAEDADMLSITGLWCEGRPRIAKVLEAELKDDPRTVVLRASVALGDSPEAGAAELEKLLFSTRYPPEK